MEAIAGTIILVLTVVMPPEKPDRHPQLKEDSLEECMQDARAFLDKYKDEMPPIEGAQGVMAGCLVKGATGPKT